MTQHYIDSMPDFDDLLLRTSRTFALSIPRLPQPTRREVTLAYLLFRIADTLEDADAWPRDQRLNALDCFHDLLDSGDLSRADTAARAWLTDPPCAHAGYLDLLREAPGVLAAVASLEPRAAWEMREHTRRTIRGMTDFVRRSDPLGRLRLQSLADLRDYCYAVAGIVGEMLTALFLLRLDVAAAQADRLYADAARFGEGLQLVNILKDAGADACQGRAYLPAAVERATVFDLARHDLDAADRYVEILRAAGADRGVRGFAALPVLLARATLDRVEREGPGAKLTRAEVANLLNQLERFLGEV